MRLFCVIVASAVAVFWSLKGYTIESSIFNATALIILAFPWRLP